MPGVVNTRPFVKCGSFKGKGAKDRAKVAAKTLNEQNPDQTWEAVSNGSKKQKGNSYAIQRLS